MNKIWLLTIAFSFAVCANENRTFDDWSVFIKHPNKESYTRIKNNMLNCTDESDACFINYLPDKSELEKFEILIKNNNCYAVNLWMFFMSRKTVVSPWGIADYEDYVYDLGANALDKDPNKFLTLLNEYNLTDRLPQLIGVTLLQRKNSNTDKIIRVFEVRQKKISLLTNSENPNTLIDESVDLLNEFIQDLRHCAKTQNCWNDSQ